MTRARTTSESQNFRTGSCSRRATGVKMMREGQDEVLLVMPTMPTSAVGGVMATQNELLIPTLPKTSSALSLFPIVPFHPSLIFHISSLQGHDRTEHTTRTDRTDGEAFL